MVYVPEKNQVIEKKDLLTEIKNSLSKREDLKPFLYYQLDDPNAYICFFKIGGTKVKSKEIPVESILRDENNLHFYAVVSRVRALEALYLETLNTIIFKEISENILMLVFNNLPVKAKEAIREDIRKWLTEYLLSEFAKEGPNSLMKHFQEVDADALIKNFEQLPPQKK